MWNLCLWQVFLCLPAGIGRHTNSLETSDDALVPFLLECLLLWKVLCSLLKRDQFFGTIAIVCLLMKLQKRRKITQQGSGVHLGELVLLLEASSVNKFL